MKKLKQPGLVLEESITKILDLKLKQSIEFDSLLLNITNNLCHASGFICVGMSDLIDNASESDSGLIVTHLSEVEKQSTKFIAMLNKVNIDSKNVGCVECLLQEIIAGSAKQIDNIKMKIN